MNQEHPIPQQISTYQFRLVGDMTLKQFFQVAGGALVSLLIYSSNLAPYIKWPFIVLSFLIGIAFAFFPLEDRPLSKWLVLFMKAIYSPTLYTWRKGVTKTEYFQPEPTPTPTTTLQTQAATLPPTHAQVSSEPITKEVQSFEQREKEFMSKVSLHFETKKPPEAQEIFQKEAPSQKEPVQIPNVIAPPIEKIEKEPLIQNQIKIQQPISEVGTQVTPMVSQKMQDTKFAEFSQEASPPTPPTKANIIVGQVIDAEGKIVENAILEIKDTEGRPVRALKSNKLGHFMIVTPLVNGTYEILTEKEGLDFENVSFQANGEIIPSIQVKAKRISENI